MYHMELNQETGEPKVVGKRYTIPERVKAVFDDFEVDYDREALERYIEETKRILNHK